MENSVDLASCMKKVSKEDYQGKWCYQLLTEHTYEQVKDSRMKYPIHQYFNAVGLRGIIPDGQQVAIIDKWDWVTTGRVQNGLLRKCSRHQPNFSSIIWLKQSSSPLAAPALTWDQLTQLIEQSKGELSIRRIYDQGKQREIQIAYDDLLWFVAYKNYLHLETEVQTFSKQSYFFSQQSVFFITRSSVSELDRVFEW